MKSINVKEVFVKAKPGTSVNTCLIESIILCATEDRDVKLQHNSTIYTVKLSDLIDAVDSEEVAEKS